MTTNRNCLSYWFPKIPRGVPCPLTEIVRWPGDKLALTKLLDGETPEGYEAFIADLRTACLDVHITGPWFLRTGQGAGKHDWSRTCFVTDLDKLGHHVAALVEWSHLADFFGLAHDVWVVREVLPTTPVATLPLYGGFPLVKEIRAFVAGGEVKCWHPYWPAGAVRDGLISRRATQANEEFHTANLACQVATPTGDDFAAVRPIIDMVAAAFATDGAWSVDLLETRHGWFLTDMAEAERSFHWTECPNCPEAQR